MSRAVMMVCLLGALVATALAQRKKGLPGGSPGGSPGGAPRGSPKGGDQENRRRIIEEQFCLKKNHVTGVTCSRDCATGKCSIKLQHTDAEGTPSHDITLCDGVNPATGTTFIAEAACSVTDLEGNTILEAPPAAGLVCDIEVDVSYGGEPAKAYFPTIIPGRKGRPDKRDKVIPGAGDEQPVPEPQKEEEPPRSRGSGQPRGSRSGSRSDRPSPEEQGGSPGRRVPSDGQEPPRQSRGRGRGRGAGDPRNP